MKGLKMLRWLLLPFYISRAEMQKEALLRNLSFPLPPKLVGIEQPLAEYNCLKPLSVELYEEIVEWVEKQPELIAIGSRDDIKEILKVLSMVHEDLHLEKFNSIQIHRGGIYMARIENYRRMRQRTSQRTSQENSGRSVLIEINGYRKRYHEVMEVKRDSSRTLILILIILSLYIFVITVPFVLNRQSP